MGEEFMHIYTNSTDRLERSLRKVRLAESDARVRMRWAAGAIANPEKYFVSQ